MKHLRKITDVLDCFQRSKVWFESLYLSGSRELPSTAVQQRLRDEVSQIVLPNHVTMQLVHLKGETGGTPG